VKRKGEDVNSESKKRRITYTRGLDDDDDIAEILVYKDAENELIPSDSDSSDSYDETDVHIVVPPNSSPLSHPSPFTFNCKCRHKCGSSIL
jgi:hypothetical protein